MILADRLAELEELCNKATPDPWVLDRWGEGGAPATVGWGELGDSMCVASIGPSFNNADYLTSYDDDEWERFEQQQGAATLQAENDAKFISAARTAVPELIKEIRRLQKLYLGQAMIVETDKLLHGS